MFTVYMKLLLSINIILLLVVSLSSSSNNFFVEEIMVQPLKYTIQRTGKLDFKRILNLSFKSSGYLTKLSVDEGDYFNKNQLLASMDVSELIQLKNSTYARLLQAKRDVNRINKLIVKQLSSERDLELALTSLETTRAAYKIAFYNLEKAQILEHQRRKADFIYQKCCVYVKYDQEERI